MALSAATTKTILSRGYTQADMDRFQRENPGDEGRALTAFSPQSSGSSSSGGASQSASTGAPTMSGSPALTGLATAGSMLGGGGGALGAAIPSAGEPAAGAGMGGGGAMMMAAMEGGGEPTNMFLPSSAGSLRQGMGQRIYPMDIPAIQGLSRIY